MHNINQYLRLSRPQKVAAYIATRGEISLNPWISKNQRHQIFLPKLYEIISPRLRFAALTEHTRWIRNRFKIMEPACHWGETQEASQMDIILLPLVAFDRTGQRMGMGGGYYDRSLAFRRSRKQWLKPRLIGVAHGCQEHPRLSGQSWDVPLDAIITQNEIIHPHC